MTEEKLEISFENLTYPVFKQKSEKPILKSLTGCFPPGKLTGILGSSGAGKTTLVNILAGHITRNLSGKININGNISTGKDIRDISTYLKEDDLLQTSITVRESMMFVAELKLDHHIDVEGKKQVVIGVINKLNLNNCLDTLVENLSGGEKRRLSIALELISDPPIVFMDEPTSGLDEVSSKQCIELLRTLSQCGKTVICTIHQPSNIVFNMLQHVYFMNDGYCTYEGRVRDLIPFLERTGYPCPTNYNPADYILEISQMNEDVSKSLNISTTRIQEENQRSIEANLDNSNNSNNQFLVDCKNRLRRKRIGFVKQTWVLLKRNFLQVRRRKLAMSINIAHHLMSALMSGFLFIGTGSDAAKTVNVYKLSLGAVAYISFAYAIIPILAYPFQIKIIKREITNDWYSLKAYFLTQSLSPLPHLVPLCFLFTIVCFAIVDPSLNFERYFGLSIILIFVAIVSHFYGHAIGALFNAKNACVIGSMVATMAMNIGAFHHYQISLATWLVRQTTFTRYGLVGCLLTFYQNRQLDCKEIICRHNVESLIYEDFGMGTPSYTLQILGLFLNVCFYAVCFYVILRIKFYSNVVEYWRNFKANYAK